MRYLDIVINLPTKNLWKQFTYSCPEQLGFIGIGWRVVVPFGRQVVEGFVVGDTPILDEAIEYKQVQAAIGSEPWFNSNMIKLAQWMSRYYLATMGEVLRLFIPGKKSMKLQAKFVLAYDITEVGRAALLLEDKKLRVQLATLRYIAEQGPVTRMAMQEAGVSINVLKSLRDKEWVVTLQQRVLRNSYTGQAVRDELLELTAEQQEAIAVIKEQIVQKKFKGFLLHGITGSGKTEVYIRLTQEVLQQGKQAIVLVPEIALTGQIVQRFKKWFGDLVVVAHSKLSANERADVFEQMRTGEAKVLVGVRSAIFAPTQNLGLIVIDEEHEYTYKQEERPNYHAREIARKRCELEEIPLVLGSATPDLCTYYQAQKGEYGYLQLLHRPTGNALPQVVISDMRQELANKNYSVLSGELQGKLQQTIEAGEQAIILLNRRGHSTFVMCRDCGEAVTCPHCAVAMVYHTSTETLQCHYCGEQIPLPRECPKCHSKRIKYFGTGTEKAEQAIAKLHRKIKILRMDQDTTTGKLAHDKLLGAFKAGEANVLLGTQMVAKGHDVPNVTLVGVLAADSQLNLPDFRAGERTFALLTQAAGRAGRGEKRGQVVYQVYAADNPIIALAAQQDYAKFAEQELTFREELGYPPFKELLKIVVHHEKESEANGQAQQLVNALEGWFFASEEDIDVLGPFPAIVARVRGIYRVNILIKGNNLEPVKEFLQTQGYVTKDNIYIDVNPVSVV